MIATAFAALLLAAWLTSTFLARSRSPGRLDQIPNTGTLQRVCGLGL
jgi:hypothetical protein